MKIGIIGGLGPLATVKFMELINERIDDDNVEIVVINDPTTPDRTSYILDNSKDNPVYKILYMVKKLEMANCSVIVMPCNTASYFYKEIKNATDIHFINIVLETVKYLAEKKIKKVGLLATKGTIKSKIYEDLLNEYGIECIIPNNQEQDIVQEVIYDGVKSNKDISLDDFYEVSNRLKKEGCEKIILGCTELSALRKMKGLYQEEYLDAMEVLADNTVNYVKNKKEV